MPSRSRGARLEDPAAEPRELPPAPAGGVEIAEQDGAPGSDGRGDGIAAPGAPAEGGVLSARVEPDAQADGGAPAANRGVPAAPGNLPVPGVGQSGLELAQMLRQSMLAQAEFQRECQVNAQQQRSVNDATLEALQRLGRAPVAPAPLPEAAPVPVLPALAARDAPAAALEAGAADPPPVTSVLGWGLHPESLWVPFDEHTNKLPEVFVNKTKHLTVGEMFDFKRNYRMRVTFDSWHMHLVDFLNSNITEEQRRWANEFLWELGDVNGGDDGDQQGPLAIVSNRMAVVMTPNNQRQSVEAFIANMDMPQDPMAMVHPGLASMQATAVARNVTQQMRALAGSRSQEAEDDALASEQLATERAAAWRAAGRGRGGGDNGGAQGAPRGGGRGRGGGGAAGRGRGRGTSAHYA